MFWNPTKWDPPTCGAVAATPSAGPAHSRRFPDGGVAICALSRQIAGTCLFYVVATALSVAVPEQSRIRGGLVRKFSRRESSRPLIRSLIRPFIDRRVGPVDGLTSWCPGKRRWTARTWRIDSMGVVIELVANLS